MTGRAREGQEWDVVVVGAGPAGATTALSVLAQEPAARVLLLDRADFPRDKCCGDGIAPHAVDVLARLGAGDVVEGWASVERLELSRSTHRAEGAMARPAWVIPRVVFDARLVERAVQAGAVLRRRRVRSVRVDHRGGGGVLVDDTLAARVVVGADGARSVVRPAVGADHRRRAAVALRGYAPTPQSRRGRQVIRFGDRPQPAYAWAFDRGDGWSNVGYGELDAPGAGLTRALFLEQLEQLLPGATLGGTSWRAHHLPLSGRGWGREQPDGPALLVGDAAGLVNPLTGEGIYYAVATGELAGRAAVRALATGRPTTAGALHRTAVRDLLGTHLHHTWAAAGLSRHPRVVDAGLRAATGDQRVFDTLVDLGLGDGRVTPRLAGGLLRGLLG